MMKWALILVAVLLIGLFIESKWEQKKKKTAKDEVASNEIYSAGEMISELKGKQDGK